MSERLGFGFGDCINGSSYRPIQIDVPDDIWRGMKADFGSASCLYRLEDISNLGGIDVIETGEQSRRLLIRADEIGEMDFNESEDTLEALSNFMLRLKTVASTAKSEDERLKVTMGGQIPDPLWMESKLVLPDVDDVVISELATHYMFDTAKAINYPTTPQAYVRLRNTDVSRRGLSLQVDTQCGVGVLASDLEREDLPEWLKLTSNNMDIYQQQVIALAGVIAVAHADRLLLQETL